MLGISFIGILIGTFSLTLTLAIMNGFEKVTHDQLQSIHSQIVIRAFGNPISMKSLAPVLEDEFPEIAAFSPSTMQQVIIQNPNTDDITTIVGLKGITAATEARINSLEQKIVQQNGKKLLLADVVQHKQLLLGKKLAESLDIDVGDEITLLFAPDEPRRKKISLTQKKARVGGFFKTGIEEFDTGLIFGDLAFVQELFPDAGITQVNVRLQPGVNEEQAVLALRNRLHIEVYHWKELYPALVSALKLEKYVMFFILALITLIASMNIISLLFMQINQKRADIAILRAMGMSSGVVKKIFVGMGMLITISASALGLFFATITCILLERYPFITLPDVYFVTHLPAHLEWQAILGVFVLVILLSLLSTWIPIKYTEDVSITQILRYDV